MDHAESKVPTREDQIQVLQRREVLQDQVGAELRAFFVVLLSCQLVLRNRAVPEAVGLHEDLRFGPVQPVETLDEVRLPLVTLLQGLSRVLVFHQPHVVHLLLCDLESVQILGLAAGKLLVLADLHVNEPVVELVDLVVVVPPAHLSSVEAKVAL